jgi:hypothetical protein
LISVLEASDVENLFDQFEAASEQSVDEDDDDLDDPETASTIMAAVHSHFVASDTSGIKKRSPRIGQLVLCQVYLLGPVLLNFLRS